MATHSSILAWRFPWTEEPGGLEAGVSESDMTQHTEHTFNESRWAAVWGANNSWCLSSGPRLHYPCEETGTDRAGLGQSGEADPRPKLL